MINVIGSGLIGSSFKQYLTNFELSDITVLASGVSSSLTNCSEEFSREHKLINECLEKRTGKELIIYISSCSAFNKSITNSPYVQHKKHMENLVQSVSKFLILRLPQVIGRGGNRKTLCNWLHESILLNRPIPVFRNAVRNIIDVEDVCESLVRYLKRGEKFNEIISIANINNNTIEELIYCFEIVLSKKAIKIDVEMASSDLYRILNNIIESEEIKFKNRFNSEYLIKIIEKYYGLSINLKNSVN